LGSWIMLVLAIAFEVAGTTCMKFSNGYEKIIPTVFMGLFYVVSLVCLGYAVKQMDISFAYAIWAGVGTMLISVIGIYVFKEEMSMMKLLGIAFVITGVVILNLSSQKAL